MKKLIYSILSVSVLLFASCTSEDRGTTTEVAHANNEESVNPRHIRGYGQDGSSVTTDTDAQYLAQAQRISDQMASQMQLDEATKQRVTSVLLERERKIGEMENRFNYTETARMGGQAHNDTERDMGNNQNLTQDPLRANNAGNAYEGNAALSEETASTMERNHAAMKSQRQAIMSNADKELKSILTAEQYNTYVNNRTNYEHNSNQSKMNSSGNMMNNSAADQNMNSGNTGNTTNQQNSDNQMKSNKK